MATPRTLEEYITQQGYRDIGGRYYAMGEDGPVPVNPEGEFYPIQRRSQVEGNVLSGLQKSGNGYVDPATGKYYTPWEVLQKGEDGNYINSPAHAYEYDPYRGLKRGSTQGDTIYSNTQPIGMYEDAGTKYWLTEGNTWAPEVVIPPYHDSYGLTDAFMDYAKGPLGMAIGAATLPSLFGNAADYGGIDFPVDTAGGLGDYAYMADAGAGTAGSLDASIDDVLEGYLSGGTTDMTGFQTPINDFMSPSSGGLPSLSSGASLVPDAATIGQNYLNTGAGYNFSGPLSAAELATIGSTLAPTQGAYQFPYDRAIGSVLGAVGSSMAGNDLASAANAAADRADPFASQRAFYQGQLRQMYENPSQMLNNPLFSQARDQAMNATQRKLVSKGYSGSGNEALEMMKAGTNAQLQYAMPYLQQLSQNAGAGFGPGQAGSIAYQGAQGQAQNQQNMWGNLGYGLGSIFQGNQPTAADQYRGTPSNQTLADLIRSF